MLDGEGEQRVIAGEFQLFANVTAVGLDGAMADEQLTGDFLVGFVLSDQAEDAALSRCERCQSLFLFFQRGDAMVAAH